LGEVLGWRGSEVVGQGAYSATLTMRAFSSSWYTNTIKDGTRETGACG